MRLVLSLRENPRHVATSFGVGVFIGMSPLLGIHTLLGLVVSSLFRLNRFVTIVGVYITNPWTIVPIYTFGTWAGVKLVGSDVTLHSISWSSLTFSTVTEELGELFVPFVVGTFFIGTISAVLGYIIIYILLKKRRDA